MFLNKSVAAPKKLAEDKDDFNAPLEPWEILASEHSCKHPPRTLFPATTTFQNAWLSPDPPSKVDSDTSICERCGEAFDDELLIDLCAACDKQRQKELCLAKMGHLRQDSTPFARPTPRHFRIPIVSPASPDSIIDCLDKIAIDNDIPVPSTPGEAPSAAAPTAPNTPQVEEHRKQVEEYEAYQRQQQQLRQPHTAAFGDMAWRPPTSPRAPSTLPCAHATVDPQQPMQGPPADKPAPAPAPAPAAKVAPLRKNATPPPPSRPADDSKWNQTKVSDDNEHVPDGAPPPTRCPAPAPAEDGWPPDIREWVFRAFDQCRSDPERLRVERNIRAIIERSTREGTLWMVDWALEPLPPRSNRSDETTASPATAESAQDAPAAELAPRTPAPPPAAASAANQEAAEAWLTRAEAQHDAGDDEAALRCCVKSLRLCDSACAKQLEKRILEFGAGSAPAKAAARVLKAADDYAVLELSRSAREAEVKTAYKKLALLLHPDRNQATQAEAAFKRLQVAYEQVKARVPSSGAASGAAHSASRSTRHDDADDLLCPRCGEFSRDHLGDEQCKECDLDDQEAMAAMAARARASAYGRPQPGQHAGGGRCSICKGPYTPPPTYMGNFPTCYGCREGGDNGFGRSARYSGYADYDSDDWDDYAFGHGGGYGRYHDDF